jgi:hypothetical protein
METQQNGRLVLTPKMHGLSATGPNGWALLVSTQGAAVERVLRVRVESADLANPELAGFWGGSPLGLGLSSLIDAGAMRIDYGGAVTRTIYADLQTGDYLLPASAHVQVFVARWRPFNSASQPVYDYKVSAELVQGAPSDFRPFTLTNVHAMAAAAELDQYIPPGAYAWDLQAQRGIISGLALNDWNAGDAAAPKFECVEGPFALRDYVNMIEIPSGMMAITGPVSTVGADAMAVRLRNRATSGTHLAKVLFYVR